MRNDQIDFASRNHKIEDLHKESHSSLQPEKKISKALFSHLFSSFLAHSQCSEIHM
jgi:hypothetical protein